MDDEGHEETLTSGSYPAGAAMKAAFSADATLKSLTFKDSGGVVLPTDPEFAAATAVYAVDFNDPESSVVDIFAETSHSGASISFDLSDEASDALDGQQVDLDFGINVVKVVVTAEGGVATQTYAITVTGALPEFAFGQPSFQQDGNVVTARIRVELNQAGNETATVDHETEDFTAKAGEGEDYTAASGRLSITPGATNDNIEVPIADNDAYQGNRVFQVYLRNPAGATLPSEDYYATVEIVDDEEVPAASMADVTMAEDAGKMTLTL